MKCPSCHHHEVKSVPLSFTIYDFEQKEEKPVRRYKCYLCGYLFFKTHNLKIVKNEKEK